MAERGFTRLAREAKERSFKTAQETGKRAADEVLAAHGRAEWARRLAKLEGLSGDEWHQTYVAAYRAAGEGK